jgi:hypothetical protein
VTVTTSLVDHKSIALPNDMRLALKNYQASCDEPVSEFVQTAGAC